MITENYDEIVEQEKNSFDNIQNTIDEIANNFNQDDHNLKISLYRKPKHKGGRSEMLNQFDTLILPDPHTIGVEYGSGTYALWITWKENGKAKVQKKYFTLGDHYDKLNKKYEDSQLPTVQNQGQSSESMLSLFKMMQETNSANTTLLMGMMQEARQSSQQMITGLVTALAPVLVNVMQPKDNTNSELLTLLITKSMEQKQDSVKDMADILKQGIEIGGMSNSGDDSSEIVDIIAAIAPHADKILSPLTRPFARKQIKKNPQIVKKIINDPEHHQQMVAELVKKHGEKKTEKIIEAFDAEINGVSNKEIVESVVL